MHEELWPIFVGAVVVLMGLLIGALLLAPPAKPEQIYREHPRSALVTYRGYDLYCLAYDRSLDCDFVRFYKEHPEL